MGNVYGIKILKIKENGLLNDVIFAENKTILPYIYYITKINKFYVENFRKGSIIKEFTLLNIFDMKEYSISIEHVESGYFFDSLEYKFVEIPKIETLLRISKVLEEGIAHSHGLKPQQTILLGNKNDYFQNFKSLEDEILKNKSILYFYDFVENKIKNLSFEADHNKNVKLGIECELIRLSEFSNVLNETLISLEKINNEFKENIVELLKEPNLTEEIPKTEPHTEPVAYAHLEYEPELNIQNQKVEGKVIRDKIIREDMDTIIVNEHISNQIEEINLINPPNEESEKIKTTLTSPLATELALTYKLQNPKEEYTKELKIYSYFNPGVQNQPNSVTPQLIETIKSKPKTAISQSKKKMLYNDF
jgi:hypothetical protein